MKQFDPGVLELSHLDGNLLHFSSGTVIFKQREKITGLYLILNGYVKFERPITRNEFALQTVMGPGETPGEAFLFRHQETEHRTTAITNLSVFFVPANHYHQLIKQRPDFKNSVLHRLSERFQFFAKSVIWTSCGSVEDKVCAFFYHLSDKLGHFDMATKPNNDPVILDFRLGRSEIASAVGARPETISRLFSKWKSDGIYRSTHSKMIFERRFFESQRQSRPTG